MGPQFATAQASPLLSLLPDKRDDGLRGDLRVGAPISVYRTGPELELEKNDPAALEAAWRSAQLEGPISQDLGNWQVPCLICAGAADEMHDDARRAAKEIHGATFVSLAGHSHISAFYEADALLLPHIVDLLHSGPRER